MCDTPYTKTVSYPSLLNMKGSYQKNIMDLRQRNMRLTEKPILNWFLPALTSTLKKGMRLFFSLLRFLVKSTSFALTAYGRIILKISQKITN